MIRIKIRSASFKACPSYVMTALICSAFSTPALAQYPGVAPMGTGPQESDVLETEEIADGAYSLPADELLKEDDNTLDALDEIDRQQSKELALSNNEKRTAYTYVGGLMIGGGRPWQVYSIDVGYLRNERQAIGLYAGGGVVSNSGITHEKAYDLRVVSRGSGVFFRQWLKNPDILSFDFSLGYTAWDGKVSPHGSDPEDTNADILSSSFSGTGVSAGIGANLTWVWKSGFHLEWIPLLVHYSRFFEKEVSRDSTIVRETIKRNIETPALSGLTSLRLGFYF